MLQIERVEVPDVGEYDAEAVVCHVMGKAFPDHNTTVYYRDLRDGHEYLYITGAFGLPGFDMPGFAVVVGYDRREDEYEKKRLIRVLDEREAFGLELSGLVDNMSWLKKFYGANPLLSMWSGHGSEGDFARMTEEMVERGMRFFISPGIFSTRTSAVKDYLKTLSGYLPILDRGSCSILRRQMKNSAKTGREAKGYGPEDNPALMAIAVAVCDLMVSRPWTLGDHPYVSDGDCHVDGPVGVYGGKDEYDSMYERIGNDTDLVGSFDFDDFE